MSVWLVTGAARGFTAELDQWRELAVSTAYDGGPGR
jgi:hypothetical protein